jgi:hypothetical protein
MGKTAPLTPLWVRSIDAMIAADIGARVMCDGCSAYQDLDLVELRAKVGGSYSLFNRRCRCRLTPDCKGWNRFYYLNGMAWAMWDDATADRWALGSD